MVVEVAFEVGAVGSMMAVAIAAAGMPPLADCRTAAEMELIVVEPSEAGYSVGASVAACLVVA